PSGSGAPRAVPRPWRCSSCLSSSGFITGAGGDTDVLIADGPDEAVTDARSGCLDGARGDLQRVLGRAVEAGEPTRTQARVRSDHLAFPVQEEHVERIAEPDRMDGPARHEQDPVALRRAAAA